MSVENGPRPGNIAFERQATIPAPINILMLKTGKIVDSSGIPLSSDREEDLAQGIDFKYAACPFHNSPSRLPENQPDPQNPKPISMLERERLATHYSDTLAIADYVRDTYLSQLGQPIRPLTTEEVRDVLRGLFFFPHYLTLRGKNPFPTEGKLPPPSVIISNSASGSVGAVEGYLVRNEQDPEVLNSPPDVDQMVAIAEKNIALVGDKTVCAASPEQMHHFLSAISFGLDKIKSSFDVEALLTRDEVLPLIAFGSVAYIANEKMVKLKDFDNSAADVIEKESNSDGTKAAVLNSFDVFSQRILGELMVHELQINKVLGRALLPHELSLDLFESEGFRMPAILRGRGLSSPRAVVSFEEQIEKAS